MLLSFNPEITAAVIQYIQRQEVTAEERELNAVMLLVFYNENDKLAEILKFCVERDVILKLDNAVFSPYMSVYKFLIGFTQKNYYAQFSSFYMKKASKIKDVGLDTTQTSKSEKKMKAYKSIIEDVVSILTNGVIVPVYVKYCWNVLYQTMMKIERHTMMKYMMVYVFALPFNDFIETAMKNAAQTQLVVLLNVSKFFHEVTSPSKDTANEYWKSWIASNCNDLTEILRNYILKNSTFNGIEEELSIELPTDLAVPLNKFLVDECSSVMKYMSDDVSELFLNQKRQSEDIRTRSISLLNQIKQLYINSLIEKQNFLANMSVMTQKIKFLNEERRYLRQLLFPDDEEPYVPDSIDQLHEN
ncbi:hypothetical protein EIN_006230 [Entamoeba invadens IP1]|uniref:Ras-GAP domain-containing protein n=1 Tax=Entamoeba invadens IP1 TaxID=370355 RepID=A0A0A1UFV5_ENTIV|nr:hypothetical protein EIN_006230 [Entamoeba invadens IP1]ELP93682.1 hypothetical protein EIN_006230 [Entamoeba invadens IP1]|eukprot:XP_004260453.1 hypothetical protein EIN_006230 [Entamoeba invadens IP1]